MKRILAVFVALASLGACASARPGGAGTAPDAEPSLPLAAFVDSAALHQALLSAPPVPSDFKRPPFFRVTYDSTGALAEVEPISEKLFPAEWGAQIAALLRRHAAPKLASAKEAHEVVWLVSGPSPVIQVVENVTEVKPVLLSGSHAARQLSEVAKRLSGAYGAGTEFDAVVSMRVDPTGTVAAATIQRSTGQPAVDREILLVAGRMRFQPGQVAGYPVTVLVSLPVSLVIPGPSALADPRQ